MDATQDSDEKVRRLFARAFLEVSQSLLLALFSCWKSVTHASYEFRPLAQRFLAPDFFTSAKSRAAVKSAQTHIPFCVKKTLVYKTSSPKWQNLINLHTLA